MNNIYGFIGIGNMAKAIINGIITNNICNPDEINIFDIDINKCSQFSKKLGLNVLDSSKQVITESKYIFLAVKPQNFPELLDEIKDFITEEKILISIAAGITTDYILNKINSNCPIIRVMPNTPLLLGEGASAICKTSNVNNDDFNKIYNIFNSCGICEIIDESNMDTIVAINGSSPAYIFLLAKAMLEFSNIHNINYNSSLNLICKTLEGTAKMLNSSGFSPDELIKMVSSPGGTTIEALKALEENNFYNGIISAMEKCSKRSKELSKH